MQTSGYDGSQSFCGGEVGWTTGADVAVGCGIGVFVGGVVAVASGVGVGAQNPRPSSLANPSASRYTDSHARPEGMLSCWQIPA
jgi:hypothetical protein